MHRINGLNASALVLDAYASLTIRIGGVDLGTNEGNIRSNSKTDHIEEKKNGLRAEPRQVNSVVITNRVCNAH